MRNSDNITLSVIVPVYNVEKYLNRCVDSILNQTFEDFELILVDDGSPDNCGNICDEYAQKDNRVKVIHKKNGGQGSARNAGIDIAQGSYISFVDSDDWIENDMFESMLKPMEEYAADISVCGIYNVTKFRTIVSSDTEFFKIMDREETITAYYTTPIIHSVPWNKIFRKILWDDIRFPENIFREDEYILYKPLHKSKKTVHIGKPKYYYNIRDGSSERSLFQKRNLISNESIDNQYLFIKEHYPNLEKVLWDKRIFCRIIQMKDIIISNQYNKYKDIFFQQLSFIECRKANNLQLQEQVKKIVKYKKFYFTKIKLKNVLRNLTKKIALIFLGFNNKR